MSAEPPPSPTPAATSLPQPAPGTVAAFVKSVTGDAFGLGLGLVVLPSVALFMGVERFAFFATTALPLTAIFGIMILFGALALVGTLYARLNLSDRTQALGLPPGSMRAFMALSLIVLFAIISIMVYRTMMEPFRVAGLTLAEREALVQKVGDRLVGMVDEGCGTRAGAGVAPASAPASTPATGPDGAACPPADHRYTLVLRPPPDPASTDLAKQLLILVGTLMTSVTSFYFAARVSSAPSGRPAPNPASPGAPTPSPGPAPTPPVAAPISSPSSAPPAAAALLASPVPTPAPRPAAVAVAVADPEAHADGCNVDITEATPDEDLPPARGGVAS